MDTESLKSLLWLLVWGGFFYFMMRHGCGAHMTGGHGGHSHGSHGAVPGGEVKDPVCGMSVDPKNAAAAAVRGGSTYYFCSTDCRDKFEQEPDKYLGANPQEEDKHGAHHHA